MTDCIATEVGQEEPWTQRREDQDIGEWIAKVRAKVSSLDFFALLEESSYLLFSLLWR